MDTKKDKKFKITWYGRNRGSSSRLFQEKMTAETTDWEVLPSGDLVFKKLDDNRVYVVSQGRYYLKEVKDQ